MHMNELLRPTNSFEVFHSATMEIHSKYGLQYPIDLGADWNARENWPDILTQRAPTFAQINADIARLAQEMHLPDAPAVQIFADITAPLNEIAIKQFEQKQSRSWHVIAPEAVDALCQKIDDARVNYREYLSSNPYLKKQLLYLRYAIPFTNSHHLLGFIERRILSLASDGMSKGHFVLHVPYGDTYCFPSETSDSKRKVWEASAALLAPPQKKYVQIAREYLTHITDLFRRSSKKKLGAVTVGRMVAGGIGWTALTFNSGESFANGFFIGEGLRKDRAYSEKLATLLGTVPELEDEEWITLLIGHEIGHRYDEVKQTLMEEFVADVPSILVHIMHIENNVHNGRRQARLYSAFHRVLLDALYNIYYDTDVDKMSRAYGISGIHMYKALVDSKILNVLEQDLRFDITDAAVGRFIQILRSYLNEICIHKNPDAIKAAIHAQAPREAKDLAKRVFGRDTMRIAE